MIQFTAQQLADFIEAIRFQAKKEMEPVNENEVKVGESVKPNYTYVDEKMLDTIDLSAFTKFNGKFPYSPFPRISEDKSNNMTDGEIDKAHDEANAKMDGAMFSDKTLLDDDSKRVYPSDISDAHRMLDEYRDEIIALRRDIEALKMANEGERKSVEYWKERSEITETEKKGLSQLLDGQAVSHRKLKKKVLTLEGEKQRLDSIIDNLPAGKYKLTSAKNGLIWELEYNNKQTKRIFTGTKYHVLLEISKTYK